MLAAVGLIAAASGIALLGRTYVAITAPAPAVGKSYTEGILGEPRTINPIFAAQDADRDISRLVFAGLLAYDGEGRIQSDLAERYEASEDGRIYTVTLRKDLFWHDGERLGADDIIFTIKTIQNSQYKSPLRANWQGVEAEKLDERTVRFVLRTAYAPFVENLAVGIIPKHVWEKISPEQAFLHERNLKPIGAGPYAFSEFRQNSEGVILSYHLARNPRYHRDGPYLKTITFMFYRSPEEMLSAWRRGIVEAFSPIASNPNAELVRRRAQILSLAMPRIFGIFLNEKKAAALEDSRMREAISAAINRDGLVSALVTSGGVATPNAFPWLADGEGSGAEAAPSYDPEASKALLKKAGWEDADGDGIREKTTAAGARNRNPNSSKNSPQKLEFTLLTSDWPDLTASAQRIKEDLARVGIGITIEAKPFAELESSVIRPRNFELLLFGQVYGYEPDPFAFWHSSQAKDPGLNITAYGNRAADRLLQEARGERDPDERQKKYRGINDLIRKDIPAVFLYSQLYRYVMPQDIQGAEVRRISLPADRFNTINQWYRATHRVIQWSKGNK